MPPCRSPRQVVRPRRKLCEIREALTSAFQDAIEDAQSRESAILPAEGPIRDRVAYLWRVPVRIVGTMLASDAQVDEQNSLSCRKYLECQAKGGFILYGRMQPRRG